jgi:hypothetical protein
MKEPIRKPKRPSPVSLHPLTPDEAMADLLRVKPSDKHTRGEKAKSPKK